jgi:hypothetical protein
MAFVWNRCPFRYRRKIGPLYCVSTTNQQPCPSRCFLLYHFLHATRHFSCAAISVLHYGGAGTWKCSHQKRDQKEAVSCRSYSTRLGAYLTQLEAYFTTLRSHSSLFQLRAHFGTPKKNRRLGECLGRYGILQ